MPEFRKIYDDYFPRIYNYVRYRVADAARAGDIVSRIFEKALARLASFDPEKGNLDAWLFAIARNAVNDQFRAQKSWTSLDSAVDVADGQPRIDRALEQAESSRELLAAVSRLDERQRELLALKFGARMKNRDIAARMELSESNTAVLIYRAIKKLQTELGADS